MVTGDWPALPVYGELPDLEALLERERVLVGRLPAHPRLAAQRDPRRGRGPGPGLPDPAHLGLRRPPLGVRPGSEGAEGRAPAAGRRLPRLLGGARVPRLVRRPGPRRPRGDAGRRRRVRPGRPPPRPCLRAAPVGAVRGGAAPVARALGGRRPALRQGRGARSASTPLSPWSGPCCATACDPTARRCPRRSRSSRPPSRWPGSSRCGMTRLDLDKLAAAKLWLISAPSGAAGRRGHHATCPTSRTRSTRSFPSPAPTCRGSAATSGGGST